MFIEILITYYKQKGEYCLAVLYSGYKIKVFILKALIWNKGILSSEKHIEQVVYS